jgi:hypothetical protein
MAQSSTLPRDLKVIEELPLLSGPTATAFIYHVIVRK